MEEFPGRLALGEAADSFRRYAELLCTVGVERGLLGPREPDRVWSRHILNCANVARVIPQGASVADVGSGAGLPGIPLALARPDLRVTLIESMLRRSVFLREVVTELGLSERVSVVRSRAEDVEATFDVVTSRAVAPLPRLLEWCLPLVGPDGCILALKGESAADELRDVESELDRRGLRGDIELHCEYLPEDPTTVVRVVRVA